MPAYICSERSQSKHLKSIMLAMALSSLCFSGGASAIGDAGPPSLLMPPAPANMGTSLRIGDRLKIAFYEKFDEDEDKWSGHSRPPDGGYHQFSELCGEYIVQDDGAVSLPIIGRFKAAGHDQDALLASITKVFAELIGRKGFVNIVSVEHQPVFVAGTVKNPGSFRYVQGMTVLQAIALAGGVKSPDTEAWQRVESGREIERLQRSLEKVKRLLVRTDILHAEGGLAPIPRKTLEALIGRRDTVELEDEESAQRKLTAETRSATDTSLALAVDNARQDLAARAERLGPLDSLITIREQRTRTVSQLVDHNTIARPVLIQTQGELADVQDRKREALIEVAQAKSRLAEALRELGKQRTASSVDLDRETASSERDAEDAISDAEGTLDVVKSLAPKRVRSDDLASIYQVVRKSEVGTDVVSLAGTAPLQPGDLVMLKQDDDGN